MAVFYKEFKGNRISTLGLGVMRLPSADGDPNKIDRVEGAKIIDRAMELGINYFDTAHIYQKTDSEKFLGEALKKYPRDSYYLATKFYGSPKRDIRKTFFEQLERLQDDETLKDPDEFEREMNRSKAITSIASQIIQSGTLSLKAAQFAAEYGNETAKPLLGLTTRKEG